MFKKIKALFAGFKSLASWASVGLKQTTSSYCDLQTADSRYVLVADDGSLATIIKVSGVTCLIGTSEFEQMQESLQHALQTTMSQPGHHVQVFFGYNKDIVAGEIKEIFRPAKETATRLTLDLDDLFRERVSYLSKYCAHEETFIVLWTKVKSLTATQSKQANKEKKKVATSKNIPPFISTQNLLAALPALRETHDSFVRAFVAELNRSSIVSHLLEVHDAVYVMRNIVDPDFTDRSWRAKLPGDKITIKNPAKQEKVNISDIMWPNLAKQIIPRDGEVIDMRTVRLGDRLYSTVYIDLFPQEVQVFVKLMARVMQANVPWRISFDIESDGLADQRFKKALSSVLGFSSAQNRLLNQSLTLLEYINLNTDDAVVQLRVAVTTWAPENDLSLLRVRTSILAKAVEGWGSCDVSEISGDPFAGLASTFLGVTTKNVATASVAPLSDVLRMLPLFRPASPWKYGAVLFRSPDGKPWPYHPGSSQQTTFIDLIYARPGSGKSVLSNAINLALCLSPGIQRLPRIAIIDIGPSSSGLISLLKDALPLNKRHQVAYHRLRMDRHHAINPFDTQLGCRFPTPQERSFIVNFLTLLVTPVGADKPYDGVADMAGLVIDELYKSFTDNAKPNVYTFGVEDMVDGLLEEIGFISDTQTTWWEVADALFMSGFARQALSAQRRAMPLLADVTAICRLPAIDDLYGKLVVSTGETLIQAFSRMISGAVREYPIISQVTKFDLGEARVVSLDLDEVARSGGDAANRQTAVMYMLARYVLGRDFYLNDDNLVDMPEVYRPYHQQRVNEIKEDSKRIVFDEFHRTSNSSAVRNQVIQDMREGRKWNVQVALLSQSLSDFDELMVEFATSVFIMDAGPEQSVRKTSEVFGLSDTGRAALRRRVHGPREGGSTFLAQFATKAGINTQLLTMTLGPVELWALTTTAEDVYLRTQLYRKLGSKNARRLLADQFPGGSAKKELEERFSQYKEESGLIDDEGKQGVMGEFVKELIDAYQRLQSK